MSSNKNMKSFELVALREASMSFIDNYWTALFSDKQTFNFS